MAEFCVECFNRINETNKAESEYIISKEPDLCEGCGQYKNVVVMEKKAYYLRNFRLVLLPIYLLWRIIIVPYTIYKYRKNIK